MSLLRGSCENCEVRQDCDAYIRADNTVRNHPNKIQELGGLPEPWSPEKFTELREDAELVIENLDDSCPGYSRLGKMVSGLALCNNPAMQRGQAAHVVYYAMYDKLQTLK